MTRNRSPKRRSIWARWLARVACVGLGTALGTTALAQGPQNPDTGDLGTSRTYLNKQLVHLPIEIDAAFRTQISNLVLFMKEGPRGTWAPRDKAHPQQTSFTFRAPQDGEYWFRIVAVDLQGRQHPDDLAKDPQDSVVVVVDTTQPQIDLRMLGTSPEGPVLQADVRDANPDVLKLRFFYQTRDMVWRSADPMQNRPTQFVVPSQAATTNQLKVMATDLAGNTSTRVFNLGEMATAQANAAAAPSVPLVTPNPSTPPVRTPTVHSAPGPLASAVADAAPVVPSTPQRVPMVTPGHEPEVASPRISETPLAPQPTNPPLRRPDAPPAAPPVQRPAPTGNLFTPPTTENPSEFRTVSAGNLARQTAEQPLNVQFVSTGQVFLNYAFENVGASGVGKLEIWATRDKGQTWAKFAEDTARKAPAEVNLPTEGLYGLKLVASNGRGFGATPPQAGDPADWWVEVDATKPKAQLTGVRCGTAQESGTLYVLWQAEDRNLAADPIEIHYAPSREGPWAPIAKGVKNDGQYRWTPPPQTGAQAFLRLVVRDKAGNVAVSETLQPVPLDDQSRPRARVLGVSTQQAPPPAPMTSSAMPYSIQPAPSAILPVQATSTPLGPVGPTTNGILPLNVENR